MRVNKYLVFLTTAVGMLFGSCSDDKIDTTPPPAVGIVGITVIPDGSAIAYDKFVVVGDTLVNIGDSIAYAVTQEALQHALVKVKPTLFGKAYYNNVQITDSGFVADVTKPLVLEARSAGGVATYVLKVVQSLTEPLPIMEKMASTFVGFPDKVIDYDVAYFKGKFYATVTSYMPDGGDVGATPKDKRVNYDLYVSEDGLRWEQVVYKTNTDGVRLPRGQKEYVVGGEGASLAVFNDRLYVLGGARNKGRDKFKNAPELQGMDSPRIAFWRSFSTADGETFDCDTVGMQLYAMGEAMPSVARNQLLAIMGMTPVVFKDKMYMFSPYMMYAGQVQSSSKMYYTEDGKSWTMPMPESAESGGAVAPLTEAAYFVFKDSLWCVGGARSYINVATMSNSIFVTGDGMTWENRGMVPDSILGNVYGMKAVATDSVVYLFGGQKHPTMEGEIAGFTPNQVLRSTDAVNWEIVTTPDGFTPIRRAKAVSDGENAWIFGGVSSLLTKSIYAYPTEADTWSTETWVQKMK